MNGAKRQKGDQVMPATARIIEVLGGPQAVGQKVRTADQLARQLRSGLPYAAFEALVDSLAISRTELARLLHLPHRTLARRKRDRMIPPVEADRLYRLARVFAHALEVFRDRDKAAAWVNRPNHVLGGCTPLSLLDTAIGVDQVDELLGRIEHGIFS